MSDVRVRFAPSPTGAPHVGNLRTALFSWLWARHTGGKFILRVEDTDQAREVENGLQLIMASLRFLGLDWDEGPEIGGPYGPYHQSERLEIYARFAQILIESGAAYKCYCTPERLEQMRMDQQARGEPTRYDRLCRYLSPEDCARREGLPYVIRLAVPVEGTTTMHDFIRGDVSIANKDVDDQVLLKSDGFPTYHLAVVVDDHLMEITHVMRGDDWIPSFPKHILLYEAFGWEPPVFGHVPIVLGADRKKLGKRHGSTSVVQFRDEGYLPEAMFNFLALLGWSYDDHTELFTRQQLIDLFTLDKINPSPAIFDRSKLDWMNGYYIRALTPDELARRLAVFMNRRGMSVEYQRVRLLVPLIQDRIKTLQDALAFWELFAEEDIEYEPALLVAQKVAAPLAREVLESAEQVLADDALFADAESMEHRLRDQAARLNLKPGQYFGVLRIAVTGKPVSPPLTGTMAVLGPVVTRRRIARARRALAEASA